MRPLILFLISLICCAPIRSQKKNATLTGVSGVVYDSDNACIAKVSVREIDGNHRVYNQTKTDRNGLFSFRVRDTQHSLQFSAPGFRTLTHKMLGQNKFRVRMERRRTSPYVETAKVVLKSDRLFNGHYLGEIVRQQAWIEKMCDSLYAFIIPVQMDKPVDEYSAGRKLIVLDDVGQQVMLLENVVDAYPILGDPDDIDQSEIVQTYIGLEHGGADSYYAPGGDSGSEKLYSYPHFQISRAQMEQICEKPELLSRIAVDTYRANNYWNFFPTDKTISLFRKALEK